MTIELRHLRYFVAVAEAGQISAAADRLYVSQPAVSQAVLQLERELGVALLRRHPGGVEPTPGGAQFLADARAALELVDAVPGGLPRSLDDGAGDLVVGLLPYTFSIAHDLLRPFLERRPEVALELRTADYGSQLEALRAGEVDVGLLAYAPEQELDLTVLPLLCSPVVAVLSEHHRLASSAALGFDDIADETWPGRHPSLPLEWADVYWLTDRRGRRPRVSAETPLTPEDTWALVVAGKAICTPPRCAVDAFLGRGDGAGAGVVVRPVLDVDPLTFSLARLRDNGRPLVRTLFAELAARGVIT